MNSTIYVFGRFGKGYTQYPNDYARDICQKCCEAVTVQAQLVIHRDEELMYYGYVHPLETPIEDSWQCIGFCIVLNGVMLTQSAGLIDLFNDAVASLVDQGELIVSGRTSGLRAKVDSLKDSSREVADVVKLIQQNLSNLAGSAKLLPPQNYGLPTIGNQELYRLTGSIEQAATQSGYACIDAPAAVPAPTPAAAPASASPIPISSVAPPSANAVNTNLAKPYKTKNQEPFLKWGCIVGVILFVALILISLICALSQDNGYDGGNNHSYNGETSYEDDSEDPYGYDSETSYEDDSEDPYGYDGETSYEDDSENPYGYDSEDSDEDDIW